MDGLNSLAGFGVGAIVGMTGVGGGALMTPILVLLFGVAPAAAIGTDLWFAALTKIVGGTVHQHHGGVDWQVFRRLALGSLPAAALTLWWLHTTGASAGSQRPSPACARRRADSDRRGDAVPPSHPRLRPLASRRDARPVQACATGLDRFIAGATLGIPRHPDLGRRRRLGDGRCCSTFIPCA